MADPDPRAASPSPVAGLATTTAELLMAAAAFFVALVLVIGVPGVQRAVFGLEEALFGRPALAPEQVRQIEAIALMPLATLLAAILYRWLGRNVDRVAAAPEPARGPAASLLTSTAWTVLGVLLAVLGSAALALLMQLLGAPVAEQTLVLEITGGDDLQRSELAMLACSALLLAPLAEELFFRRQLFVRIRRASALQAYLASSLLFAAFHNNLQGFIVYTWLGVVFAATYARTGRIGAAMAAHFGNNAVTLLILLTR